MKLFIIEVNIIIKLKELYLMNWEEKKMLFKIIREP